ncbi:hypothetical protein PAAG_07396 [Paracoccidioides lutzii Pb01]|uniref:Uncharacterized protein n=1 Tax=Paracoccidioides lutzii (strain ATCC MYA-826 / Pb01) TaxID=502779 RepID=C1H9F5_PARBA|nr:hypothetical protein PAAG_07396 [Paracoccidioides lutzii Pb01]EEH36978.1 hypothetical protein PAAG_07396 [Paracoccidioides lutzii Pb01]
MTGKLTLHKSPKRKCDETDYQRINVSTFPSSSQTTTPFSVRDGHLADDHSPDIGNSPPISVAAELHELDLYSTCSHGLEDTTQDLTQDKKVADRVDEGPFAPGEINLESSSLVASIINNDGGTKTRAFVGRGSTSTSPALDSKRDPKTIPHSKHKSRRKSPPLSSTVEENPLTWHDSEITGYAPTDPNDDGYGINGIGFKPTAAVAWERSQRRKKQVAEWKSREAREARERRKSRRDGITVDQHTKSSAHSCKKVKFDIATGD